VATVKGFRMAVLLAGLVFGFSTVGAMGLVLIQSNNLLSVIVGFTFLFIYVGFAVWYHEFIFRMGERGGGES